MAEEKVETKSEAKSEPKRVKVTIKKGIITYGGGVYREGDVVEVDEATAKSLKDTGNA